MSRRRDELARADEQATWEVAGPFRTEMVKLIEADDATILARAVAFLLPAGPASAVAAATGPQTPTPAAVAEQRRGSGA